MKTTHSITISLVALLFGEAAAHSAAFAPGEFLMSNFTSDNVQRYSPVGVLEQTYGSGSQSYGASLTPDGNLVTSFYQGGAGIRIFSPDGTQIGSFAATGNGSIGDVSVFANGTIALNDATHNAVQLFSQSGTLLNTVIGASYAYGNTVGLDNILYVASLTSNSIVKVDQTGAVLGSFAAPAAPGDLVMSPMDGTLWITGYNTNRVYQMTTGGTPIQSFATGLTGFFDGIAFAQDGNSLYVKTQNGSVIRHLDLTGTQLGDFNIVSPGGAAFLTVVPAVPEPAITVLLLGGAALLARRRHCGTANV